MTAGTPTGTCCLAVGRWGHLDVRMLVEDHAEGRCLVRVALAFGLDLSASRSEWDWQG